MVNRAGHGRTRSRTEFRETCGRRGWIPNECGLSRWKFAHARIVRRIVDRLCGIERFSRLFRGKIVFYVRFVVREEVRPSEIPGLLRKVELIKAGRSSLRICFQCVRADIAPEEPTGLLIDAEAKRISTTHDIDLGQSFWCAGRKQVARWNCIGA